MSALNACRVCLAENLTMYRVTSSPYEEIYEKLTNAKLGKIYPDTLCYICVSVLRKFQKFATLAQHSNIKLKQWYKKEIECKPTTKPMFTISTTTVEYVSMINTNNDEKMQIKVEQNEDTEEPTTEMQFIEFTNETDPYIEPEDDNDFHNDYDSDADQKPDVARMSSNEEFEVPVVKKEPKKRAVKRTVKAETKGTEDNRNRNIKKNTKKLTHKKNTKQNIDLKHTNILRAFPCKYCNFSTIRPGKLRTHIRKRHSDINFNCNICDYVTVTQTDILSHKIKEHLKNEFICDICGYYNKNKKKYIVNHMVRVHNTKSISCYLCDYKCTNREYLDHHMTMAHTKEKLFLCHICDYKCKLRSRLLTHLNIHKDRKLECEYCNKKFVRKEHLLRHVRIHTGEKPYVCPVCGQRFNQDGSMKLHLKRHYK